MVGLVNRTGAISDPIAIAVPVAMKVARTRSDVMAIELTRVNEQILMLFLVYQSRLLLKYGLILYLYLIKDSNVM